MTILAQERETRAASAEHVRHARTARAGRSGRHTGDRQARPVRRRSDEVRGLVVQTEIVLRSRGPAVSARVDGDRYVVDTETQRNPRQRRKRTQHTDVPHSRDDNCRSRVGQVSQCRRERRVRGLEAVRDGVGAQASDEVCGTPDECAGVPIQRRHSNQAFNRDNENQSTKTVDDDIKIGVTMLGMEDMRVRKSTHQVTAKTVKDSSRQRQRQGRQGQETKAKDAKSDDQRKCFYCQKIGHVKLSAESDQKTLPMKRGNRWQRRHIHTTQQRSWRCSAYCQNERHTSTFVMAMPCANSETSCESSSEQAVRIPDAGSIAPAETQQVRPIAAIPSNETYLMMDTCAACEHFSKRF